MKKYSWILALLFALTLAFVGCPDGGGGNEKPPPEGGGDAEEIAPTFTSDNLSATGGATIEPTEDGKGFTVTYASAGHGGTVAYFKVDLGEARVLDYEKVTFTFTGIAGDLRAATGQYNDGPKGLNLLANNIGTASFAGNDAGLVALIVNPFTGASDGPNINAQGVKIGEDQPKAVDLEIAIDNKKPKSALSGEVWFSIYMHANPVGTVNGTSEPTSFTISNVVFVPLEGGGGEAPPPDEITDEERAAFAAVTALKGLTNEWGTSRITVADNETGIITKGESGDSGLFSIDVPDGVTITAAHVIAVEWAALAEGQVKLTAKKPGGNTDLTPATYLDLTEASDTIGFFEGTIKIPAARYTNAAGAFEAPAKLTFQDNGGGQWQLKIVSISSELKVDVESVTITGENTIQLGAGTLELTATVLPANATNKTVTWASSDTAVATISTAGVVTPVAVGTTNITATADGVASAAFAVEVTAPADPIVIAAAAITLTAPVTGRAPETTATTTSTQFSVTSVAWSDSPTEFAPSTAYTATLVLTAAADYFTFTGVTGTFTIAGATVTVGANAGATLTITAEFAATSATPGYSPPASGTGFFYLDLSNFQPDAETFYTGDGISYIVAADVVQTESTVTVPFTANNQRVTFKLTDAQATALSTAATVNIEIVGTATPDSSFRYHLGDPTAGSSWNATNSFDAQAFSAMAASKALGFSANKSVDTLGYLLIQQREAATTSVVFTSIKISYADPVAVTSVAISGTGVTAGTATIDQGTTLQLTATVLPENATDKSVVWSTSAAATATVSNAGLVTAIAAGNVTITATAGGQSDTVDITINAATTPIGAAITLAAPATGGIPQATVSGLGYTGDVAWKVTGGAALVGNFAAETEYTAEITLVLVDGYVTDGVTFTVANSTSVSYATGVITVVFPATGAASTFGLQGDGTYTLDPTVWANWYSASSEGNAVSFTGGGRYLLFPAGFDVTDYAEVVIVWTATETKASTKTPGGAALIVKLITEKFTAIPDTGVSSNYGNTTLGYPNLTTNGGPPANNTSTYDYSEKSAEADPWIGLVFQQNTGDSDAEFTVTFTSITFIPPAP